MNRNSLTLTLLTLTAALAVGHAARIEENDPSVAYNGAWTSTPDAQASGGSYMMSSTAGATVTFNFTGDSLVLYRYLSTNGGMASVTVDTKPWGNIYFNFTQPAEQVPAVLDHLGAGSHTIVLTVAVPFGATTAGAVTIDAFEFPTTFLPNANQTAGIATINQVRTQAGLPLASLSTALNLAAQAHTDYAANGGMAGVSIHEEVAGQPGFIGVEPGDRAQYFGYDQGGSEVMNPGGDTSSAVTGLWMGTVYHRTPFVTYSLVDIGCGTSQVGQNGFGAVDFGVKRGTAPPSRTITTWPANNQTAVPLSFSAESPNPVPNADQTTLGYPISLHIAQAANVTKGTDAVPASATLTGPNNQQVAVTYIDRNNDPNQQGLSDDYFMVPQQPLAPNTTYTANITGTDTQGNKFNQTWSFATVAASAISGVGVNPVGVDIHVIWSTAGPVTSTSVQFGPTAAYGTTVAATTLGSFGPQNLWVADLKGLAGGTYHYQVVATDAAGVTSKTADATFVAPSIPNTQVSIDGCGPSTDGSIYFCSWHTFGPVISSQILYGTDTNYTAPGSPLAGAQQPDGSFFAVFSGLTPNTLYHYKITATDANGTNGTPDMTFTAPATLQH
jgi:uncharacterized protein YkwD